MTLDAAPANPERHRSDEDSLSLVAYRFGYRTGIAAFLVGGCVTLLARHLRRSDEIGIWTWAWLVPFLVAAAALILWDLFPVRLVANTRGLTWRSLGYNRTIPWSDIEAIGIARSTAMDGWDHPTVRRFTGAGERAHRNATLPMIGVRLKPEASGLKDPASRAYQLGFTGYELHFSDEFDMSLTLIVDDLQARLARSRETSAA